MVSPFGPSRRRVRLLTAGLASAALLGAGLVAGPAAADDRTPLDRYAGYPLGRSFERLATFGVYQNSPDPSAETVAEITAVSSDAQELISTDSPGERVTFTDISDPSSPAAAGALAVGGEPTSVAVYGSYALIAVNTSDSFTAPSGELLVIDLADRSEVARIDLGGQPDAVAVSPAGASGGAYAAIAIENERDEDVNDGEIPQLPGGFLITMALTADPADWVPTQIDLESALTGVAGVLAPTDPEPEYVTINAQNRVAVTLQENNAIAVVDLASSAVVTAYSAGTVDLFGIDVVEDDTIDLSGSLADVPREPDGIAWVGNGLVATANEGDLLGGSRGWSIFDAATGRVVWDAGNSFELLAVTVGLYPESRSENKGSEPESITVSRIGGRTYAFVGSERGNFVAVYDLANPRSPKFVQVLPVTNGPEGLLAIPARGLFVTSSEVDEPEDNIRATIGVFRLGNRPPQFPSIAALPVRGVPLGWGALSGLSGDPRQPNRLWSVGDSYYSPTKLFSLYSPSYRGTGVGRAVITSALTLTEDGEPVGVDAEGIAARRSSGFWLAAEGESGPENEILLVDAQARIQRRIALPAEVSDALGSRGLEGIAVTGSGVSEQVYVALQSPLATDPVGVARIGRYQVSSGTWTWFGYQLEMGSNVGLSELVALGGTRFAVLERDNLPGPDAAVKRVYTVDLTRTSGAGALPVLTKTLARDLLPVLSASNGWVQEKVEGLAVAGNGQVYLVTDNDGVEDATGETLFANLGSKGGVFGR